MKRIDENLPANSVGGGGVNLDKPVPLGTVSRSMGLGTQHKNRASRDSQEQKKHGVKMALAKRMKARREKLGS